MNATRRQAESEGKEMSDSLARPHGKAGFWFLLIAMAICAPATAEEAASSIQKTIDPSRKLYPIDLKCPSKPGDGTLQFIMKNKEGFRSRLRVTYKGNIKTLVIASGANPNEEFQEYRRVNVLTEKNPDLLEKALSTTRGADRLKNEICEGDKAAQKWYSELLEKNKLWVGP